MEVQGTVEAVKRDGKGFKLNDGNWYNNQFKSLPENVQKGVDVKVLVKDGTTFWNKVEVTGGAAKAPAQGGDKKFSRGMFPIDPQDGQVSIIRQNALTNANAFVGNTGMTDADPDTVIAIARTFEAYTTGKLDQQQISDGFDPEE